MKNMAYIIEEYRNGDFEQRLSIFLCHRSMRDEFMRIEQQEDQEPTTGNETNAWLEKPIHRPYRWLVNWCCGVSI